MQKVVFLLSKQGTFFVFHCRRMLTLCPVAGQGYGSSLLCKGKSYLQEEAEMEISPGQREGRVRLDLR